MNDGQNDVLAELKKIREENAALMRMVGSGKTEMLDEMKKSKNENKFSDSSAQNQPNDELIKELYTMRSEMEQLKEKQEEQKKAYRKVCEKLQATEQVLETQKNAYDQVSKELAELRIDQEDHERNMLNDLQNIGMEIAKIKRNASEYQNLSDSENSISEMPVEFSAMRLDIMYLKEWKEEQEKASGVKEEEQLKMQSQIKLKLAALKTKLNQDGTSIAELKEKQLAQDLKLQQHDEDLEVRKVVSLPEQLAGKWHLLTCDGNKERYKTYTDAGVQKVNFDVLDFKVLPDRTVYVLTDGSHDNELNTLNPDDGALEKSIGTGVYYETVRFYMSNSHLVLSVRIRKIFTEPDDDEFTCEFLYERY